MREFAAARGWTVAGEYVDLASASDFGRRTEEYDGPRVERRQPGTAGEDGW